MIPTRFLPPKFDYSRPIPSSLLQNGSNSTANDDNTLSDHISDSSTSSSNSSSSTTRNRNKNSSNSNDHNCSTLDCVICYNSIDINSPRRYMLAPCDHIFHRHCLEQWMDVKMECPICRMDLPPV